MTQIVASNHPLVDPPMSRYRERQMFLPPRLGQIKKGGQKPANGPGPDLDYFRFVQDGDADVLAAWKEAYPKWDAKHDAGQPRKLNVLFFFPEIEQNLSVEWVIWGQGGIYHACDDQTGEMHTLYDQQAKKYVDCRGQMCPYRTGKQARTGPQDGCVRHGSLVFMVPALGRWGHLEMSLHSSRDINAILSGFRTAQQMLDNLRRRTNIAETIDTVPFVLSRYPAHISKNTPQGLIGGVTYPIKLEIEPAWISSVLSRYTKTFTPGYSLPAPTQEVLPAPQDETDDSIIDVTPKQLISQETE